MNQLYRGISLLSIPGKVFSRLMIDRVIDWTEIQLGDEKVFFLRGFRKYIWHIEKLVNTREV